MHTRLVTLFMAASLALGWFSAGAQSSLLPAGPGTVAQLDESGQLVAQGHMKSYRIRHLPVTSFPELPEAIQNVLIQRACLIPQTYQAHRPENVVRGRFQGPGSSDWAVLCSADGMVSLLVFFGSNPEKAQVLATAQETERLQEHDGSGLLGFNWAIDPASPQRVHEAQISLEHRPPWLNHDALADSLIDHHTVYHFFAESAWTLLNVPDN